MKQFLAVAAVAAGLLSAAPAMAVTNGSPDGTAHPFVANLLFRTATGFWSCTGTLMSPTVVLTAGHCTEEAGEPNLNTWVTFEPVINIPPSGCNGDLKCFIRYMDRLPGWTRGTAHPHPSYDDFNQWPATYDIGVIVLDKAVTKPTYGRLPPLGFLETIVPKTNSFTVVGYGQQGEVPAFYSNIWERYVGTVQLVELESTFNAGMTAKYTSNAGIGGGTCFGDSGGPIFHGKTNIVASVVSWGITPCIGVSYEFRTDTTIAQDFLRGFGITP
jgi:hypothetical protein